MKQINFRYIVKIQNALMRIFEAEDDDYVDYRVVKINERAIEHWLDKITNDQEERDLIVSLIEKHNFNSADLTFKPMCDEFRKLGYEIMFIGVK